MKNKKLITALQKKIKTWKASAINTFIHIYTNKS